MADRGLDVFEKYDLEVMNISKGRGVLVADTDKGLRLLKNYIGSGKHLIWCADILDKIDEGGIILTDAYVKNTEDVYITESEDGDRYVIKKWYVCRNCDIKVLSDVLSAVRSLAFLHKELNMTDTEKDYVEKPLEKEYHRKYTELVRIKKYLGSRHQKNHFEGIAAGSCDKFIGEALEASERVKGGVFDCQEEYCLCHGNYNYHNICFSQSLPVISNFEKMTYGNQMMDLYSFMRKIMEKNNWDLKIGYGMITEYDRIKPIKERDLSLLHALFLFPEKYWNILNGYYNSNKAWIPEKNTEKLINVINQNVERRTFIDTLG